MFEIHRMLGNYKIIAQHHKTKKPCLTKAHYLRLKMLRRNVILSFAPNIPSYANSILHTSNSLKNPLEYITNISGKLWEIFRKYIILCGNIIYFPVIEGLRLLATNFFLC